MSQDQIDELWARLDVFHQENESLKLAVSVLEQRLADKEREVGQLRANEQEIMREVALMGTELNQARQSAADAVRDHIALTSS